MTTIFIIILCLAVILLLVVIQQLSCNHNYEIDHVYRNVIRYKCTKCDSTHTVGRLM